MNEYTPGNRTRTLPYNH